jgi:hypothetical protein
VHKVSSLRCILDISNDATKNLIIDQNIKDKKEKNMIYMNIPCTINGIKVIVFFNSGANISVVNQNLVKQHIWIIIPKKEKISTAFETELRSRIKVVPSLIIKVGKYLVVTNLEVENLSRERQLLIGKNIYYKLEIKVFNLLFAWPTNKPTKSKRIPLKVIKNDQLSSVVDEYSIV